MRVEEIFEPLTLIRLFWPSVRLYGKQREIVSALAQCDEVVVPAGNALGKDFVGGLLATAFFLRPQAFFDLSYVRQVERRRTISDPYPHTVRALTTSVKDDHLRVLWGEIGRFVDTAAVPLRKERGGLLVVNHRDVRRLLGVGAGKAPPFSDKISYLRGTVSEHGEGLAGHHAAYTLCVIDEASGVDDQVYDHVRTWAKKILIIGNPNPCPRTHFFYKAVKGGDVAAPN